MARGRKKTIQRNSHSKRKNRSNIDKNLAVVVMIVVSILLMVLIYAKSGWMGEHLSPALGGLMGWMKYILPIGTFILAIYIAKEDKKYITNKIGNYTVFLICIAIIMSTYQISVGRLDINDEFGEILSDAYDLGKLNIGGGFIGTILAVPLTNLVGIAGTVIISIGISLINMIFMFGIKPAELISNLLDEMKARREERYEEELEDEEEVVLEPKKRNRKTSKEIKDIQEMIPLEDQITINLNEREHKKYTHGKDDLVPLTKESIRNSKEEENNNPNIRLFIKLFKNKYVSKAPNGSDKADINV